MSTETPTPRAQRADVRAPRVEGGRAISRKVRLSAAEDLVISSRAAAAGMSDAAFMRVSSLRDGGSSAEQIAALRDAAKQVSLATVQLHRVGNNLNQIALRVNTGVDVREVRQSLDSGLHRVNQLAAELESYVHELRGRL